MVVAFLFMYATLKIHAVKISGIKIYTVHNTHKHIHLHTPTTAEWPPKTYFLLFVGFFFVNFVFSLFDRIYNLVVKKSIEINFPAHKLTSNT